MSMPVTSLSRRRVAVGGTLAALALAGATTLVAPSVQAATPNLLQRGTCSGRSVVTLQLAHSDPGIVEAGFQIDNARPGSTWGIVLTHNGLTYFNGVRRAAADGSFSVDRRLPDLAGRDTVSGRARNSTTGEVCTVSASI